MMCFGLKDRKRLKTNHCVIVLLDDTQLVHELHAGSSGQDLLDVVIKHLNLLETSYFGLKYYPDAGGQGVYAAPSGPQQRQPVWLDMERGAIKQLRGLSPMTVHFGVKYYAADPCKLAEEITRYQFFLQCKQDILAGRLPVSFELAIELFGLAVQSELGDYDPGRHLDNYTGEFQFVAHQTLELEQRAALCHRQLAGQVPATAELNFLEKVKWLDLYGCQLHPIQYDDGDSAPGADLYALGLNPSGVLVLRNRAKVAQYLWTRIVKTKCQGRCFLMDVIETGAPQGHGGLLATAGSLKRAPSSAKRSRFGFRLADKEASRRLRWAVEEHKHFHHLIHSTATLNQLARHQRQQQQHHQQQQQQQQQEQQAAEQLKLSQRFRNSIRSAINLGVQASFLQQQQHQAQLAFQHQQQRLRSSVKSLNHSLAAGRPPPAVVRTPSRRYSNRSLPRPGGEALARHQMLAYGGRLPLGQANGNGLPMVAGMSHTLMPDQRQQAMLLMASQQQQHQFQQHQFGLPAPGARHQLTKSHTLRPVSSKEAKQRGYYQMMLAGGPAEVSILPPGQHIVQPSIYRATSVVDGINQLADVKLEAAPPFRPTMMQQFFSTRPRPGHRAGHESPRSTKSAMAPSSALKLASKKLAKQQQQLLYGAQAPDVRPLLGYEPAAFRPDKPGDLYYSNLAGAAYSLTGAYSASVSPRSARNQAALGRSKSTSENLHLAHKHQAALRAANSKMLLTTVAPPPPPLLPAHILPPPDYNTCNETPRPANLAERRKAAGATRRASRAALDEDNFYCSRSDCSSIEAGEPFGGQGKARQARFINGRLVNAASPAGPEPAAGRPPAGHWPQKAARPTDPNNNSLAPAGAKNIANKQATPILLSIGQHFDSLAAADHTKTNSKAVQLLNLQRQHLQASGGQSPAEAPAARPAPASSGSGSAGSSVASSPQLSAGSAQQQVGAQTGLGQRRRHHTAADSTGSSSTTTSGYYAGSNSTEQASVDSDGGAAECGAAPEPGKPAAGPRYGAERARADATPGGQHESTRARMALGLHGPSARRAAGVKTGYTGLGGAGPPLAGPQARAKQDQQHLFYLGERAAAEPSQEAAGRAQWAQLEQTGPASLKYVSFDV